MALRISANFTEEQNNTLRGGANQHGVTQRPHRKLDNGILQLVVINRNEEEILSRVQEQIDFSEEGFSEEKPF
ncbi:hypothetical protein Trydic_g13009 [Trypoxylus dichotomus]